MMQSIDSKSLREIEGPLTEVMHFSEIFKTNLKIWASSSSSSEELPDDRISQMYIALVSRFNDFLDIWNSFGFKSEPELDELPGQLKYWLENLLNGEHNTFADVQNASFHVFKILDELRTTLGNKMIKLGFGNVDDRFDSPDIMSQSEAKQVDEIEPMSPKGPTYNVKMDDNIVLFLDDGKSTKKVAFSGRVSQSAIQMLFLRTFENASSRFSGAEYPKIQMKDKEFDVFYEIENFDEIQNGSVLRLQYNQGMVFSFVFLIIHRILVTEDQDFKTSVNNKLGEISRELANLKFSNKDILKTPPKVKTYSPSPTRRKSSISQRNSIGPIKHSSPLSSKGSFPTSSSNSCRDLGADDSIKSLRRDLAILRQGCKDFKSKVSSQISQARTSTQAAIDEIFCESKDNETESGTVNSKRNLVVNGKKKLENDSGEILESFKKTAIAIDEMKEDIIERGSIPTENKMLWVEEQMSEILSGIESLKQFMASVRPLWKDAWEKELQNIVDEQNFLKSQEESIEIAQKDHVQIMSTVNQLHQFIQLRSKGVRRSFKLKEQDARHSGLKTVMQELIGVEHDSERRIQALEKNQKTRQQELNWRSNNEFEQELENFVSNERLRKTGGVDEVDRDRRRKDEDFISKLVNQ